MTSYLALRLRRLEYDEIVYLINTIYRFKTKVIGKLFFLSILIVQHLVLLTSVIEKNLLFHVLW